MVSESLLMASKFEEDENVEVELELCLSLGGPFKKSEKTKPKEQFNGVRCMKDTVVNLDGETTKKREANRYGGEGECKKIRTECNGVDLDLSFSKMGNSYGSGQKYAPVGSPVCTCSDVSDPSSSSRQEGGTCDFGAQSNQTEPNKNPVNNISFGTDGSKDAVVVDTQESLTMKPPKPSPNGNGNSNLLRFAQMPCVTSTGNGPNGKTVNGFLYRYSKSEISIICVCHGTSFSPAEFIVHAGWTNVSHPLRHITVVPSTF